MFLKFPFFATSFSSSLINYFDCLGIMRKKFILYQILLIAEEIKRWDKFDNGKAVEVTFKKHF